MRHKRALAMGSSGKGHEADGRDIISEHLRDTVPMLSSTNFWMCFAGLIYLVAIIFAFYLFTRAYR